VTWPAVLSLAGGTYLIRLTGLLLRGRVTVPARVERYLDLGATALLVALVAVSTFTQDGGFAGWARPLGVVVGAAAAWWKVPFVLVVILAAGTTALLRLVGLP
jgi:branched-subunit amino acid transport protein